MLQTPHFKMVFAVFGLCLTPAVSWSDDTFRDQVAPILQRRCLSCHNDEELKGDLSLQSAKAAFADGYIERGDSSASYLLDVITPQDGSAQMPKDADPLSTEEIALIRDWIDSGADWPKDFLLEAARVDNFDWWSYRPLQRPNVPELNDDWVQTPIDAFVLQRLNELDLSHNESADRRTLIRRVTYDLTGLPPTPKEVEQFVNDPDPRSYEKLVDRLLESDRYGERWARHWLDVVKYADTQGYDKDKLRPNAWPYRDYVIRSFNEDKPYGRFVQEQIAGDVLFPGEPDGILGLGFIAAGPWDFIGHVEVSSEKMDGMVARNLDRDDMVANTLNTFCSVTVQCARCHNHKFDPITQEHYYGLQSMFAAVDRAERPYDLDSGIAQQRRALLARLSELRGQEQKFNAEVAKAGGPQLAELAARIGELEATTQIVKEPEFGYHSDFASRADVEKWVEVDLGQPMELAQIVLRPCHDDFGGIGAGFGFPMRFRVEGMVGDQWRMILDRTESDVSNPGVNPVEISVPDSTFRKIRVTATRLADRQDVFIFALAELQALRKDGTNAALGAEVASLDSIEAPVRWGRKNLTDGRWARSSNDSQQNELALARRQRDEILAGINTPERAKRFSDLRQAVQKTEDQLAGLPERQMVFAATTQFEPQGNFQPTNGTLRDIHVLHRGNVQQPKEPAIPCVIPLSADDDFQFDPDLKEGERRAALSRWLTDPDHPLVWRSIVNRIWQYHFGRGIVETPNDFGRMGALPSHPELLDWLAVEFRDGGQSMKSLHRLIVTSSVYRQSSQQNAANAQVDSSNQFLWRMNRRRLEAEEIRDSILSVTGVLDLTMGGPGFYLFELEKTEHSPHYEYHLFDPADPASHRRSIYRFIVRSQPDPWMTTFDCADSSQSTPRRTESLTALQALSLMNSRFNLVMAKRFAARLESESPDLETQVELAMQWTLQRAPTDFERADLLAYAQNYGLTNLCRVVLNFSEFVFVD